jgi:hypothetical protein
VAHYHHTLVAGEGESDVGSARDTRSEHGRLWCAKSGGWDNREGNRGTAYSIQMTK